MSDFIIKQQFYDEELSSYYNSENDIKRYFKDEFSIPKKHLQKAIIFKEGPPKLKVPKKRIISHLLGVGNKVSDYTEMDFENAVKLNESMNINRVQASDERLWAYLCHIPYFKFIKNRYKPQRDMKQLELIDYYSYENEKDRTTIRNYIKNRFFTTSDNRSLRRNGLAFLWWAAELTQEPWAQYDGIPNQNKDKYFYTKIILEDSDIYASTFERTIGKEPRIVFPLLDCIHENELGRKQYREVIKKLNSEVHLFQYSLLPYKTVREKIDNLIDT